MHVYKEGVFPDQERLAQVKEAHLRALYALSQLMDQNDFILTTSKLESIHNNCLSLVSLCIDKQKDIFYDLKKIISTQINEFLESHTLFIESNKNEKMN